MPLYLSDDDVGVSPVVGVILMVAIVVSLAAAIAVFVTDLGDLGSSTNAGVEVENTSEGYTVTVLDMGSAENVTVRCEDEDGAGDSETNISSAGTYSIKDENGKCDHLTITGEGDNSADETVIYSTPTAALGPAEVSSGSDSEISGMNVTTSMTLNGGAS